MQDNRTPVLIIGGGVAGLAAAIEVSRRGMSSLVVEKDAQLGGHVAGFCCKAVQFCAHCGACRLGDLLAEVKARPEIEILTRASVKHAELKDDTWRVAISAETDALHEEEQASTPQELLQVTAGSVVLAVGHTPFDPAKKTRFGYGRVPGVISALELEAMLSQGQLVGATGEIPGKVAFIQCVGSRDKSLGNLYCSRVCCGFALDMADCIKGMAPEAEITFFHMDVQTYGPGWERAMLERRQAMRFVRGIPGEVRSTGSKADVLYAMAGGQPQSEEFDLVVLSVGLTPPADAEELSRIFSLTLTEDGFLGRENDMTSTTAPGVFVAGAARGPRGIVESIDHAASAAGAALGYLAEASHA